MKKLSLFILTLLLSATCVWADVSVTENFTQIASSGAINTTTTADGLTRGADVCSWLLTDIRWAGSNDKITIAQDKTINAMWLSLSTGGAGTITTTNLEGGLKKVEFKYARFGSEYNLSANPPVTGRSLRLKVSAGTDEQSTSAYDNNDLTSRTSGYQTFSHAFENKSNVQLSITNISTYTETLTNSGICRILVGDITITPYLLYTTKSANLDTRSSLTYTNNDLIDNTTGTAVEYSIAPTGSGATINSSTGQVTATDETKGDFTITATWGEVTTTYTLTIVSRTATTASFADAAKRVGLDAQAIVNPLTYTDGYDGTIAYSSSNTAIATVNPSTGAVAFAGGVGQTTITATLPQTDNYKAASASYILYVEDNSASVQVEAFSEVPDGNAAAHMGQLWQGDVCEWRVSADGGVRKNSDKFASDLTRTGIWMGTPDPNTSYGSLTAENGVEGGIKHLWFYCEQPYNTGEVGYTLKPVVYLDEAIEANKVGEVEVVGTSGADNIAANRQLFGASNVMKSNGVLIIRNESFKTDDGTRPAANISRGRLLLDNIHITPYLLYTDKTKQTLRVGGTYTRTPDIDNTGDETGTLTYSSSNPDVATVNSEGQVTAVARGTATITAKFAWSVSEYVTTTYEVEVFPVNCETFSSGETTSNYAANEESASGDKATWKARLAGITTGDFEPYVAFIRAPRQGEDKEAYLESSAIEDGIASMTFDWNLVAGEANTTWDIRILINGREVKRLGDDDLAEASKDKMENFAQITIPAINEPGNFIIRFENHSTVNGTYTSANKARFVIDNICWTNYSGTKTLAENVNNEGWIRNNTGSQNVAISRSELRGGMWNTLCLPFALPVSTLGVVENGVQQLNSASLDGDELTIGFTPYTGDNLVAGTPYLVQPSSDVDISDTYNDVTITSIASPVVVGGGLVTLQGIFSPKELTAGDKNSLFVGAPDENGDNLFYPEVTGNLLGFRAYFKISEGGASSAPAIRRARFIVNEAQSPTALDEADNALQSSRKVLENGHLFIIRDGKKYNVTGQKIQ